MNEELRRALVRIEDLKVSVRGRDAVIKRLQDELFQLILGELL